MARRRNLCMSSFRLTGEADSRIGAIQWEAVTEREVTAGADIMTAASRRTKSRAPAGDDAPTTTSCASDCPVLRAARVVEGKWTALIIRDLLAEPRRFSELQRSLAPISPRLLTARLRLLEQEGVVRRTVYPTNPPATEYALTPHGDRLHKLIEAMADFGRASQRRDARAPSTRPSPSVGRVVHRVR